MGDDAVGETGSNTDGRSYPTKIVRRGKEALPNASADMP